MTRGVYLGILLTLVTGSSTYVIDLGLMVRMVVWHFTTVSYGRIWNCIMRLGARKLLGGFISLQAMRLRIISLPSQLP